MSHRFIVRPLAEADLENAAQWYDEERPGLAQRFLKDVDRSFVRLRERPLQFPVVAGDVRRALLHTFPYANHLTIRRDEVEARVLKAMQEKLLNQDLDEFCQEFTREMNRLRMERRASLSSAKRETEALRGLIDAITLSPGAGSLKIELKGNLAAMLGARDIRSLTCIPNGAGKKPLRN